MNIEHSQSPATQMSGTGYLVVHVTTARGSIPIEGAQVSIRNLSPEGSPEKGDVIASLVSGKDGNTAIIPLSAPLRTDSMKPGGPRPYATYSAEVRIEGFYDQIYNNIPIFDGITAIQPVDLIPLPENGKTDSYTPDGIRYYESEAPNL